MWHKLWNIAKRECAVRMKKPAFWILSFMGPVVLMILSVVPYTVTNSLQTKKELLINVPESSQHQFPLSLGGYEVQVIDTTTTGAYGLLLSGEQQVLCDLLLGKDTSWTIYTKESLHPADSLNIMRTLSSFHPWATPVRSRIVVWEQVSTDELPAFSPLQQTIALVASILVYFFLFTYSVSLLKGVLEEKSNKVMDLILSSVSPSTWIMGKITGVGLASFVQFMLWLVISYIPFYFFKRHYGGALNAFSAEHIHSSLRFTEQADLSQALGWYDWLNMLNDMPWMMLVFAMILAMVLGFILYAALFAMIGMIAGREADAQPYVLPVTSPLIFSFITSGAVIADPYGAMAQVLSAVPFTAPVVLTLRAGLGVSWNELWMNFCSLGLISAAMVWSAGNVYKRMLNKGGAIFRFKR